MINAWQWEKSKVIAFPACKCKSWLNFSPRDSHVIIVSGCLILTAVNLIVLIRMAYITKRLVKLCKIYCDLWHLLTWSVCTGERAGGRMRRQSNFLGWIVCQIFLPMVLRCSRASLRSAKKNANFRGLRRIWESLPTLRGVLILPPSQPRFLARLPRWQKVLIF